MNTTLANQMIEAFKNRDFNGIEKANRKISRIFKTQSQHDADHTYFYALSEIFKLNSDDDVKFRNEIGLTKERLKLDELASYISTFGITIS